MPSSMPGLADCNSQLWDPGQEWIIIFDNLLKHPGGVKRGCSCDICRPACPLSTRLSLPTNLYKTGRRRGGGREKEEEHSAGKEGFNCFLLINIEKKGKKSERAGPHPIGQKGQLVKRSLGPKS